MKTLWHDTLIVRTRFGGCKIALHKRPVPVFVTKHDVDGEGKKSIGFKPYININWGGPEIDVFADFVEVMDFFFMRK